MLLLRYSAFVLITASGNNVQHRELFMGRDITFSLLLKAASLLKQLKMPFGGT